ncbi:MAG: riboflavin synthase [Desulfarculaceae bacterium]|nr:riboflavin synthase [Desulfarculaceae bacterium]MCF8065699.1 riboflavin synthase [Desulfarculaceae bacterium]MCF8096911.1 riboflavin synthase [Desulfarculaceae bacterium]MCF8120890.1 riboflavin synthase [Desulfarculaceae bacterium]
MFTGLVEGRGRVGRIAPQGPDSVLSISAPWPADQTVLGESIAVNGACLTVTRISGDGFTVDVSAETLERTTLGRLRPGDLVNLERAMQLGDRLGGHLVTGHIDCVGVLQKLEQVGGSTRIEVGLPAEHLRYVVEKGSVALSGISLTVNWVGAESFSLNIIPHTMDATTLNLAKQGDSVNIETDLIGKYVARLLIRDEDGPGPSKGLSAADMKRMGW